MRRRWARPVRMPTASVTAPRMEPASPMAMPAVPSAALIGAPCLDERPTERPPGSRAAMGSERSERGGAAPRRCSSWVLGVDAVGVLGAVLVGVPDPHRVALVDVAALDEVAFEHDGDPGLEQLGWVAEVA